jgi:tetratricopeptide (TPR) repeat protein
MASLAEGQGYLAVRQPDKALPLLSRASELFSSILDPVSAVLADVQAALAECWLQSGDRAKAKALLDDAKRIAATHPHLGLQHLRPLMEVDKVLRSYGSH